MESSLLLYQLSSTAKMLRELGVLSGDDQEFCKLYLTWNLSDIFLTVIVELYAFMRKT